MRAFFGTLLGPDNQRHYQNLIAHLTSRHPQVVRAIPAGTAHFTYLFVPALPEAAQPAALDVLQQVARRHSPIAVTMGPVRILSAGRAPRLLYAEVVAGASAMRRLADDLTASLRQRAGNLELRPMRSAHLTLARFRKQAGVREQHAVEATLADPLLSRATAQEPLDSIALLASTLTAAGASYRVIERHPLGAPATAG